WSRIRSGISARHGGHHVAQKLIRTTFPWYLLNRIVRPLMSLSVSSGLFTSCPNAGAKETIVSAANTIACRIMQSRNVRILTSAHQHCREQSNSGRDKMKYSRDDNN